MKTKHVTELPVGSTQYVMYQVKTRAQTIVFSYVNGILSYKVGDAITSEHARVIEKLGPILKKNLQKSQWDNVKIYGSLVDDMLDLWYVTSNNIVMPWVDYHGWALGHCTMKPVFFGRGDFFLGFDYGLLNTDFGSTCIIHNMYYSSSHVYTSQVIE